VYLTYTVGSSETLPFIVAEIVMYPGDYLHEIGFIIWCDITKPNKQVNYHCGECQIQPRDIKCEAVPKPQLGLNKPDRSCCKTFSCEKNLKTMNWYIIHELQKYLYLKGFDFPIHWPGSEWQRIGRRRDADVINIPIMVIFSGGSGPSDDTLTRPRVEASLLGSSMQYLGAHTMKLQKCIVHLIK